MARRDRKKFRSKSVERVFQIGVLIFIAYIIFMDFRSRNPLGNATVFPPGVETKDIFAVPQWNEVQKKELMKKFEEIQKQAEKKKEEATKSNNAVNNDKKPASRDEKTGKEESPQNLAPDNQPIDNKSDSGK